MYRIFNDEEETKIFEQLLNYSIKIYFFFRSVVSYNTIAIPIFTVDAINAAEKISVYDSLDADVIQSYMEYSLASMIFFALKEGACSEQSARMTAMDNASKNAGMSKCFCRYLPF